MTDTAIKLDAAAQPPAARPLETAGQARLLLHPLRFEIMQLLAEPHSCRELAQRLGCSAQKATYHLRALEQAGLATRVAERKVRALTEGIYQATARHFWPGAALLHSLGGSSAAQDALSRSYLLGLAEELGGDAARLALGGSQEGQEQPTLSVSAGVSLPTPRHRSAFLQELQLALQHLAEKYGVDDMRAGAEQYKLILACYPADRIADD